MSVDHSVVLGNQGIGILVMDPGNRLTVERTVVRGTLPGDDGQMMVWMILAGVGRLIDGRADVEVEFRAGDVMALPAATSGVRLATASDCEWLEVTVPTRRG